MDVTTLAVFVCVGALGLGAIIALLHSDHKHAIRRLEENQRHNSAAIRNLENQAAYTVTRQDEMETQASRLYQEQINMKFEAMDACKAMLREAARQQNNRLM